ncbi:hypothetical protein BH23BAC4_BH23BAC4_00580 [soil metagenome]
MDSGKWIEVKTVLAELMDASPEQRASALNGLSPEIRREVEPLLDAYDTSGDFLSKSPAPVALSETAILSGLEPHTRDGGLAGRRVGPYDVIERIGVGGMGEVYLAERADGLFEQRVALKAVKRGADTDAVLKRFAAERKILGRLIHPGIARMLAAGTTDDGRPWLAMDYVDGIPITKFAAGLTVEECVRLVADAADIVHAAHQNLVVHRDLKPSNILVARDDAGQPQVKLLDFGIAKLLDEDGEGDVLTETGVRPMTRAYAAPEQLRGEPATTATDVYALGVLLYEILTGARPCNRDSLVATEAAILNDEPIPPSKLLGPTENRSGDLRRKVRGDLDTICLKALRKEPPERYASVAAFGDDLRRHLARLPIEARKPTFGYRLKMFTRRNRTGVIAALILAGILLGTGVAYTVQVTSERTRAQIEAEKAAQVAAFMGGLFRDADPAETGGTGVSAREVLDRAVIRLAREANVQPVVQAQLYQALGEVYGSLALFSQARNLLAVADSIRTTQFGPTHPDRGDGLLALVTIALEEGRYGEAEELALEAVSIHERAHGRRAPRTALASARLARVLLARGAYQDAEVILRRALERLGDERYRHEATLARIDLGRALQEQDRFNEAEAALREALEAQRNLHGPQSTYAATAEVALGGLLQKRAHYTEAGDLYEAALQTTRLLYGDAHPATAEAMRRLAGLHVARGELGEAEELLADAFDILQRTFAEPNVRVAAMLNAMAVPIIYRHEVASAEPLLTEGLAVALSSVGEYHPVTAALLSDRAYVRAESGDLAGAEADYRQVLAIERALRGREHTEVAMALSSLATVLWDQERSDEAIAMAQEALAMRRRLLAPDHPALGNTLYTLASFMYFAGHYDEAEPILDECRTVRSGAFGPDDWRTIQVEARLAHTHARLGRPEASLRLEGLLDHARATLVAPEHLWVTDQIVEYLADI